MEFACFGFLIECSEGLGFGLNGVQDFWAFDELDESQRRLSKLARDSVELTREELDEFLDALDELRSTWTVDLDF